MKTSLRAFTLMEVMVVMAVLAIIATLVYPTFTNQIKKVRSEEGILALMALYTAQKNYFQDTGTYAGTLAALEVTIPTMQNFTSPTVYANAIASCSAGTYGLLASVASINDGYTLDALEDGRVVCACGGICQSLGFPNW